MPVTAIAPNANALVTVEEARAFFPGMTSTAVNDMLQVLVNRASDFCESALGAGRPLRRRAFSDLRLPGQGGLMLFPPVTPIDVTAPIALSVDGVAQTVWKAEADGDPALKDVIVGAVEPGVPSHFYRACGWRGCTPYPVLLSYTGGWAAAEDTDGLTLPEHVKHAALLVVQTLYRHQEKQLTDVGSLSGGPAGGSVTFTTLASLIPQYARQVLESLSARSM
jgi:hypothetical protein